MMNAAKDRPGSRDQRRHVRFESAGVLRVQKPGGNEIQEGENALVNISEGGLLFYSAKEVKPGDEIQVHMEIPEFNSSISVRATTMWVQRSMEREDNFFVGVEFKGLKEPERGLIRKLKDQSRSA